MCVGWRPTQAATLLGFSCDAVLDGFLTIFKNLTCYDAVRSDTIWWACCQTNAGYPEERGPMRLSRESETG